MKKYAVLFLGLLITDAALADECDGHSDSEYCYQKSLNALARDQERRKSERDDYYNRTQAVQVITPNSSYLAYPSADGRTVSVYGGLGRGFERE